MTTKKPKICRDAKEASEKHIAKIMRQPQVDHHDGARGYDDMAPSRVLGASVVQSLRELACRRTGLTMDQLLEAERAVVWPREIVPVEPSPAVLARRRMKDAHVPELFVQYVADKDPVGCQPFAKVREFLNGPQAFLVLSGGVGTRKSGSSCWALGQLEGGCFIVAQDIVSESIANSSVWQRAQVASLLVLDDLGLERARTDGEGSVFYDAFYRLFNGVYTGRRRMIITCNITRDEFKARYEVRLYDRLRECGTWCDVEGESARQAPRERVPGEDDQ